jgi:uncharacterized protein YbjT (DUF2867 family)
MKYVLTGGAGHITKPLAEKLLSAGHQVTIIGRNADNLKELTAKGAKAAIGSVEDTVFLKQAFAGADAVYTMVPPNFAVASMKGFIAQTGKNYTEAIKANNIKYVVNLSSIGAHMAEGCGPVSGLYRAEESLNTLKDVNIIHLRPGYFYYNLLSNAGMIKHMNIMGSNFGGTENFKLVLSDTNDIAEAAAEELQKLSFKGHIIKYIASDERNTNDIAKVLGNAIGKPELPWVAFTDEQALGGMLQAGLPEEIAKNYTEMGHAMNSGKMAEDYWKNHPPKLGSVKLEDFAKTFAAVYQSN